jgi:hypothetical protein
MTKNNQLVIVKLIIFKVVTIRVINKKRGINNS